MEAWRRVIEGRNRGVKRLEESDKGQRVEGWRVIEGRGEVEAWRRGIEGRGEVQYNR